LPFESTWSDIDGLAVLTVTFKPSKSVRHFLDATSVVFMLLVAASAYVILRTEEGALRFLLPLFTGLAVLALPFVTLGIASSREALESRVRRAIKAALVDDEA
jgi:hypothetical protein